MKTLVKICGITNLEDARTATAAGADFLGFIFVPGTPRCVTPAVAAAIIRALQSPPIQNPKFKIQNPPIPRFIGVFQDVAETEILSTVDFCGLDLIQLHGGESEALVRSLGPDRCWKMISLRSPQDVEVAVAHPAAAVLVDAEVGAQRGGTGRTCDWDLAAALAERRRTVLAGGLTPENIAAAVRRVRPWAVDVSSGVEAAKGKKDPAKIRALLAALAG